MKSCVVRPYIEKFLSGHLGAAKVEPDQDGDYSFRKGSALISVRIHEDERGYVSVFSQMLSGVRKSPQVLEALNAFNAGHHFIKAFWAGGGPKGDIVLISDLRVDAIDDDGLRFIVDLVTRLADEFDTTLKQKFGGKLMFRDEEPNAEEVDV